MSRFVKLFKTVRNNWKKSVLITGLAIYAADYGRQTYEDSLLRTAYCLEAKKYGEDPIFVAAKARRVTVFLNPAANGGKGKKIFEKNVAPLLYLAGMEVTVIKTEYEGQTKKYMSVIDETDTDAIIVAGGDGTLLEVVTGLLRRDDRDRVSKIPIGVIPIGKTNQMAKLLFDERPDKKSQVWWLSENAMSIIQNQTKPVDVMHIKGENDKNVYAVSGINWGLFRETNIKKRNYWYMGPLKDYWTYFRTTIGPWPPTVSAQLSYDYPCDGCSRCVIPPPPVQWKWWHVFIPPKVEVPKVDYSQIVNERCGETSSKHVTSLEIAAACNDRHPHTKQVQPLVLTIWPGTMSKSEFIQEGTKAKNTETSIAENIATNHFTLKAQILKDEDAWFSIDSEDFEVMNIDVRLLREKLNIFSPAGL